MNKDLKAIVARYVEKVGVEKAISNAANGIASQILCMSEDIEDKDRWIALLKFKFAVIEYLYFHDDTTEEAVKLGKDILNDIQRIS